ncbi:MAG: ribosome maturation factor RimP [Clostridia bacterium]|nr:ribosome maturation factor RimP [Clostridia bacterium]
MQIKPIEDIRAFLEDFANPMNIEIVDVEFDKKNNALTVYIETEQGVDLDTCEKFHNAIFDPIDVFDPTYGEAYTLNVSSPGLDRPFKTKRDFERNLNKEVEIKLYAPLKGVKYLEGVLLDYDGNTVTVGMAKEDIKISLNKIAKINKAIKFD